MSKTSRIVTALFGLTACGRPPPTVAPPFGEGGFTIIGLNDTYRIEGDPFSARGGLARVRTLRHQLEAAGEPVLVLHAGDLLSPSFMGRLYDGEQMVDVLNLLDGDPLSRDPFLFATLGNHELDLKTPAALDRRIRDSAFQWLSSNLRFARDDEGRAVVGEAALADTALVGVGGLRVGLLGVLLDRHYPDWVLGVDDPTQVVAARTAELRARGADVVVALTHQALAADVAMLGALGALGPDLVIGGHEHEPHTVEVGGRWVLKGAADAHQVVVARVRHNAEGVNAVSHEVLALHGDSPAPDPAVQARIDSWDLRHRTELCARTNEAPDCLDLPLSRATVGLEGEELRIRRFETNLGDWVADQALAATASQGAQLAFVNSGALRLNRDLPAGVSLSRRVVEELFAYPSPLRVIKIDGATLDRVLERSALDWSGNGHWLQVAGITFRHDPAAPEGQRINDLHLLTPDGPTRISADQDLRAATLDYLVNMNTGQDGYTMLLPTSVVGEGPDLKLVVLDALRAAGDAGVAPIRQGRVCNPTEPAAPCLLLP
jgi:2',3'-cyclic-nucleotide 2'-phosphodiesterase (5'-nucleotidase family)